jgi:hypothetical protein
MYFDFGSQARQVSAAQSNFPKLKVSLWLKPQIASDFSCFPLNFSIFERYG